MQISESYELTIDGVKLELVKKAIEIVEKMKKLDLNEKPELEEWLRLDKKYQFECECIGRLIASEIARLPF